MCISTIAIGDPVRHKTSYSYVRSGDRHTICKQLYLAVLRTNRLVACRPWQDTSGREPHDAITTIAATVRNKLAESEIEIATSKLQVRGITAHTFFHRFLKDFRLSAMSAYFVCFD